MNALKNNFSEQEKLLKAKKDQIIQSIKEMKQKINSLEKVKIGDVSTPAYYS
jgi:hypothetical protein